MKSSLSGRYFLLRLFAEDISLCGDDDNVPGNEFAAVLQGFLNSEFHASAARYFHPYYGHALDVIVFYYIGQLFRVVDIIQLGTTDKSDFVLHESAVEIAICICCAVCCDQQVCIVEIRSVYRRQFDLDWPLSQLRRYRAGRCCFFWRAAAVVQ